MSEYYPTVIMNGQLSDLGVVGTEKISDGVEEFECEFVTLSEGVKLVKCNKHYYIDKVHEIRRLDEKLIAQYNLKEHFYVYRPLEEKKKPTGAKSEPVAPKKSRAKKV